ncbi:helicase [Tieghemiomyces parasiticus]|uniref:Helicase n=1 Tax=Tieghemiomyces parasiticus TaxID=78921 RepID=A0A9W8DU68_9FUNG|nr:helicase [Tieghemiomyces parasiticus]
MGKTSKKAAPVAPEPVKGKKKDKTAETSAPAKSKGSKYAPPSAEATGEPEKKRLFEGWTGKTPVTLLNELCRKRGWDQPVYDMKRSARGFQCQITLSRPDKKSGQPLRLRWSPKDDGADNGWCEAANLARHLGATYALHRLSTTAPLYRVLPPEYRDYWHGLDALRKERGEAAAWQYEAEPFTAQNRYDQEVAAKRKRQAAVALAKAQPKVEELSTSTKWPVADMSADWRERLDRIIREYGAALEDKNETTPPAKDRNTAIRDLTRAGFREDHVREALLAVATPQAALDWLCLHVPEDDLPAKFLSNAYRPEVTLHRHTGDTLGDKYAVDRLVKAGFPRSLVTDAWSATGGEVAATAYRLVSQLVGQTAGNLALPASLPGDEGAHTGVQEMIEEETEALASIYGDQFKRLSTRTFSVELETTPLPAGSDQFAQKPPTSAKRDPVQSSSVSSTIEVHFPATLDYPQQAPAFVFLGADYPAFARLHLTRQINEVARREFSGDPMVFSVLEHTREAFKKWLEDLPTLTSILSSLSLDSSASDAAVSTTLIRPDFPPAESSAGPTPSTASRPASAKPARTVAPAWARAAQAHHTAQTTREYQDLLRRREKLPSFSFRKQVLDALAQHQVVIVNGATGCGKTTQIPQFILDHGLQRHSQSGGKTGAARAASPPTWLRGRIICTQPRRISAVGVAQRVAQERCEKLGLTVGYAVRGQSVGRPDTCLQFCTTGVLLRMLLNDQDLTTVGCVVVDEVHERSVDSDFLLIILKDLIRRRPDLRVVLMSATLDADRFQRYFGTHAVLDIPGFAHPVSQVYPEDIMRDSAYAPAQALAASPWLGTATTAEIKPCRASDVPPPPPPSDYRGPRGRMLSEADREAVQPYTSQGLGQAGALALHQLDQQNQGGYIDYDWIANLVRYIDTQAAETRKDEAVLIFQAGVGEIAACIDALQALPGAAQTLDIYPLHANLTPAEQARVFRPSGTGPHARRKVVVATNVAETSITIDDVVYVIDTGRVKETQYDATTGMTRLVETWASRAACRQRQGRAGRTRPGICFKLFTRHSETIHMAAHPRPELLRTSLEQLCLQIKALGRTDVRGFLNRALDPPPTEAVETALDLLHEMSLVDPRSGTLTILGQHVAAVPTDLRVAKLLVFAALFRCVEPALTIAALLSVGSPLVPKVPGPEGRAALDQYRQARARGQSDLVTDAALVAAWEKHHHHGGSGRAYCRDHFLAYSTLREIRQFKSTLFEALKTIGFVPAGLASNTMTDPALNTHAENETVVKAIILAGLYPNVAHVRLPDKKYEQNMSGAIQVEAEAKQLRYFLDNGAHAFVHPTSVAFHVNRLPSQFVAYFRKTVTSKVYLRDVTVASLYALLFFGGTIEVDHQNKLLKVGPWIQVRAWPRVGVLVNYLRKLVDQLLQAKLDDPALDISNHPVIQTVIDLIESDGL